MKSFRRFNEDLFSKVFLGGGIGIVHLFSVPPIQYDQSESKLDGIPADNWCICFKIIQSFILFFASKKYCALNFKGYTLGSRLLLNAHVPGNI